MDEGAGKGPEPRPTNLKKYRSSPLWANLAKSKCCGLKWEKYHLTWPKYRTVLACPGCGTLKTPEQGVTDVAELQKDKVG
jgi:hypothetical protein